MHSSTKESLKFFGTIILVCSALVAAAVWWAKTDYQKTVYGYHSTHAVSAQKWSNGTLDDAKRVVTYLITHSTEAGEIKISGDYLRGWEPDKGWGFDDDDIVIDYCYMHLSKTDYLAYRDWLKSVARPYITGEKLLSPPYMPPPWDKLKK